MPVFRYRAFDADGRGIKGELEAARQKDAAERLRGQGLFATEISLKQGRKGLLSGIPERELALTARQLSTLLSAGTPLFDALSILSSETENPRLAQEILEIKEMVGEGVSLARSLESKRRVFPEFLVRVVEAGEESGALEQALLRAADYIESRARLREKVATALVYPAVMTVVGSAVLAFIFIYVLPRITVVFEDSQRALPLVTAALFFIVDIVSSNWLVLLVITGASAAGLRRLLRTESGRRAWERSVLGLPVIGGMYRKFHMASFAATLGHLLISGIPILKALDLTSKVLSPDCYRAAIAQMSREVAEGGGLSVSMKASGLFPAMLVQMVSTGEKSGELPELLIKSAGFYERDFDSSVARALALLEPAIILCMGLVVGFIVVAILLPLFELSQVAG